ncbi:putative fluoride ion transporter CrcB [Campylobacterota bacterium]|nr:putative fluoride ion transporter CrcB [Campylobacterota bacterium]
MVGIWFVALGGALGAVARYLVYFGVNRYLDHSFAYATLIVNVLGAFAALFILTICAEKVLVVPVLRLFAIVGFLGAFTTFSTYTYETIAMLENTLYLKAVVNIFANNLLSFAAGVLGIYAAKVLL